MADNSDRGHGKEGQREAWKEVALDARQRRVRNRGKVEVARSWRHVTVGVDGDLSSLGLGPVIVLGVLGGSSEGSAELAL